MVEFATDARGQLRHPLNARHAVQASHQRIVQRCWYCLSPNSIPRFPPFRELNDSFRQFLDKQRYAIGPAGDLIKNRLRKSARTRNAGRDRPDCDVP